LRTRLRLSIFREILRPRRLRRDHMLWCSIGSRCRRPVFRWRRTRLLLYGGTIVLLLPGFLRSLMMPSVPMVGVFTVIGTVTLRHRRDLG
jgi:hypothetical protein